MAIEININNIQPLLVSGTNIKTINGQSLMGSGNIPLSSMPLSDILSEGNQTDGNSIIINNGDILRNEGYISQLGGLLIKPQSYGSSANIQLNKELHEIDTEVNLTLTLNAGGGGEKITIYRADDNVTTATLSASETNLVIGGSIVSSTTLSFGDSITFFYNKKNNLWYQLK